MNDLVLGSSKAMASLIEAAEGLRTDAPRLPVPGIVRRRYLRPLEEASLLAWFARFLTVRASLWEVISDVSAPFEGNPRRAQEGEGLRCFVLGYAAACAVVGMDRFLVDVLARSRWIRRKLNEGSAEHRIPRKQFTRIYKSLADPRHALAMLEAMQVAERNCSEMAALASDPAVGFLIPRLPQLEQSLDPSKRRFLRLLLDYRSHSSRRRGASARQQLVGAGLEASGRLASELRNRWRPKAVSQEVLEALRSLLVPGDVLITRHEQAFTNLFLPGFWPHAALYVGSEEDHAERGIRLEPERAARWRGSKRTLEALKDGVRFRELEETLAVDAVAVIRPRLAPAEVAEAITRAAAHEGKLYNFDFDFFRSDRLVCTEVVYRAYDGVGGLCFRLRERAGRPTLAAEDLLDLALEDRFFQPVAVFGAEPENPRLITGRDVAAALASSYRKTP